MDGCLIPIRISVHSSWRQPISTLRFQDALYPIVVAPPLHKSAMHLRRTAVCYQIGNHLCQIHAHTRFLEEPLLLPRKVASVIPKTICYVRRYGTYWPFHFSLPIQYRKIIFLDTVLRSWKNFPACMRACTGTEYWQYTSDTFHLPLHTQCHFSTS
ncbi:hypothetical protein GQ43DRAFT_193058 [Delitschia confertaspora ATCC 74209]|uniref:Uncharacterized protein n=1 Tax=Delitschia confertaspora ATCC 74209 TaxID=1513339 RepID=A0A9P4JE11_9PLEO|nr:hypothetical protein GQ43DRAFT_193058 [Delitschia confertaspora ATCC 74209]